MSTGKITLGPVPHFKETWDASKTYKRWAIVFHNGSAYICTTAGTTTEPSYTYDAATNTWTVASGWALLAVGAGSEVSTYLAALLTSLGKFTATDTLSLAVGQSGKYVNTSGTLTSNASFAVSAVLSLTAGRIYLFPSSAAVGAAVAAFAKVVTGTREVGIDYTYTYDSTGKPLTATADYDSSIVYTFNYDSDGELESITDANGDEVDSIPATRSYSYTEYKPLFFSGGQLPSAGVYVYLCVEDEDIVVSGYTADIDGGTLTGVHYDVFTAIAYALNDRIEADGGEALAIAHLFASLDARIGSIEKKITEGFGKLIVDALEVRQRFDDYSTEGNTNLSSEGAPRTIPDKPGQRCRDKANSKYYTATDNTSVDDWKLDTNA